MTIQEQAQRCAELIREAENIGVLSGAGISTSAGIPDFRGPRGLYVTRQYDPEKVFDIGYFHHDPKPFYTFARDFLGFTGLIEPTLTHRFFAELEVTGKIKGVITQNIDGLHQAAGSKLVYEMHGSFQQSSCRKCNRHYTLNDLRRFMDQQEIPSCSCSGVIKPDIVFFGENVQHLHESAALAESCDLFFVLGTSCAVYPAATIPHYVDGRIVIVNLTPVDLPLMNVVLEVNTEIDTFFQQVQQALK